MIIASSNVIVSKITKFSILTFLFKFKIQLNFQTLIIFLIFIIFFLKLINYVSNIFFKYFLISKLIFRKLLKKLIIQDFSNIKIYSNNVWWNHFFYCFNNNEMKKKIEKKKFKKKIQKKNSNFKKLFLNFETSFYYDVICKIFALFWSNTIFKNWFFVFAYIHEF